MTDKPIIFSGPMVRAIIEGRKTQFRVPLDPQPDFLPPNALDDSRSYWALGHVVWNDGIAPPAKLLNLTYEVGDRLWVREAWSGLHAYRKIKPSARISYEWWGECHDPTELHYWADGNPECGDWEKPRPSIHMPRWASRITLTVIDVRVQRAQGISVEDCHAEGVTPMQNFINYRYTHGPGAWGNDWVEAITFTTKETQNEN